MSNGTDPFLQGEIRLRSIAFEAQTVGDCVEGRRTHLFGRYVKRMFQRLGKAPDAYPQDRTTSWLSWLARNRLAARHGDRPAGAGFPPRLILLHGLAATGTFVLAVLTALAASHV